VLDALRAKALGDLPDGPYVRLTMADTGSGMDDVTKQRIFEPFFTTKPVGKGTGLGLSTVFGIVKQSGGAISIDSSPGKGATFRIYLPQIDAAVPVATGTRAPSSVRGAGRLLLVEDDAQVRRAMLRLLKDRGFDAIAVSSKAEALAVLAGEHDPIALMITDVVMPGGDGVSLAKEARIKVPDLRVLFMSGYTEHAVLEDVQQPGTLFMAKPFLGNELDLALKALLGTGDIVRPASLAT
jgi:CheY-like chemotaxis protein